MKISVHGAGCIGGSIALKLKEKHHVTAFDRDEETMKALEENGIETVSKESDLYDTDLLVLALPMSVEERFLKETDFSGKILDVASVKTPFMEIARERGLNFTGGHPMAGNERKGKSGWDREMFDGKIFFLCSLDGKEDGMIENIVKDLGARPLWIDYRIHDEIVAAVSHVQYLISLSARYVGKPFEEYAGPGYLSNTRLSKQNMEMALDMIRYNKENILKYLENARNFLNVLYHLTEKEDFENLKKVIREVIS
ncbi:MULTISPECIES: prephenate dehydrogenase [unclassified Thermotoga]|uniref:prephenate dehydrogenase n=1 Tax=unclassified Thermotoga TaxID=2631113 RepID=UPI000543C13D|nr:MULTISPECIES: prephenate dehydrogenase [unclassified Thermotoga]KHC91002.1 Prephenate dehydrogenase [Thermotoga sp. TBGT1765]KHC91915.1 Prephenate dehydrogenase [Thermotoga sp. TBGT1766]